MGEDNLVDIVDKKDRVVGQATKEEKFAKELISRNVVAFIKNKKGELIIVKRSPRKRSWPNRLDLATCGNVNVGETYHQAITREIKEEIGTDCPVKLYKKIYTEVTENNKLVKYFTAIFIGETDRKPKLSDELIELKYIKPDKLGKKMKSDPNLFSPSFIREFKMVKAAL